MPLDPAEFASAMATYLAATDHSIALRRGIASALPSGLLQGEPYYATDTKRIHVGHGDTTAKQIPNVDDISAANLLTAIKTVDGAGSGLDADLLDGQTGAYYATAAQPTATAVSSFLNSWVNYAGGFQTAEYWKDTLGYVHIHGIVKSGTINQPIFTLPEGYRPAYALMFSTTSNGAHGAVYVEADGDVICTVGNNAWVSLCGIMFKV